MKPGGSLWDKLNHELVELKRAKSLEKLREETEKGVQEILERQREQHPDQHIRARKIVHEYIVGQVRKSLDVQVGIHREVWKTQDYKETPQFLRELSEKIEFIWLYDQHALAKMLNKGLGSLAPPTPELMQRSLYSFKEQFNIAERECRRRMRIEAIVLNTQQNTHKTPLARNVDKHRKSRGRPPDESVAERRKIIKQCSHGNRSLLYQPEIQKQIRDKLQKAGLPDEINLDVWRKDLDR